MAGSITETVLSTELDSAAALVCSTRFCVSASVSSICVVPLYSTVASAVDACSGDSAGGAVSLNPVTETVSL